MDDVRGEDGELVQRLLDAVASLSELDALDVSTWIAFAIGGEPMTKRVRRADVAPIHGTVGAQLFLDGVTVELDDYLPLISKRLNALVAAGVREDFLIRSVAAEATRELAGLADIERGNQRRADTLEFAEASGVKIPDAVRRALQPLTDADAAARKASLAAWTTACEAALSDQSFTDWMMRRASNTGRAG